MGPKKELWKSVIVASRTPLAQKIIQLPRYTGGLQSVSSELPGIPQKRQRVVLEVLTDTRQIDDDKSPMLAVNYLHPQCQKASAAWANQRAALKIFDPDLVQHSLVQIFHPQRRGFLRNSNRVTNAPVITVKLGRL